MKTASQRKSALVRGLVPAVITSVIVIGGQLSLPVMIRGLADAWPMVATGVMIVGQWVIVALAIGVGLWLAMRLDGAGIDRFGLAIDRQWVTDAVAGVLISLVAVTAYMGYGAHRGHFTVDPGAMAELSEPGLVVGVAVLVGSLVLILLLNVWEEIIFRASMLQNFAEGLTTRGYSRLPALALATVGSLVVFGLYHLPGHGVFAPYTMIVGLLFVIAYVLTGNLGLAIGIHFGRFPIELLGGDTMGAVTLPAVYEPGTLSLGAILEVVAVEVGLTVVLILGWVLLTRGRLGIAARTYRSTS